MATYSHHQFAYSYPTQLLSTNISGQTAIGNGSYNNTVALGISSPNSINSSVSPTSGNTGIGAISPSLSNNNNNIINNNNLSQTTSTTTTSTNLYCSCTTRSLVTDPMTGQSVCTCQYDSRAARLSLSQYPRTMGVYGTTPYPSTEQNPYPSISVDSPSYFSSLNTTSNETMPHWSNTGLQPTTGYYHYDHTLAAYGYGPNYDIAARRKNASRESTNTLKAWLNEHRKNPYPTKGEKIMLAIITKMTLTQVSTWFANARRRLKKENKMTWEPKNKADDDADTVFSDNDKDRDDLNENHKRNIDINEKTKLDQSTRSDDDSLTSDEDRRDTNHHLMPIQQHLFQLTNQNQSQYPPHYNVTKTDIKSTSCGIPLPASKPKIWSLADTAASKTPPRSPTCLLQVRQNSSTYQEQPQQEIYQQQYNQFGSIDQRSTKLEQQSWQSSTEHHTKYLTSTNNNFLHTPPTYCQEAFLNQIT